MNGYVSNVPKNCNDCKFKEAVSRHWELEDYCALTDKDIYKMVMEDDCPLTEGRDYVHSATLQ